MKKYIPFVIFIFIITFFSIYYFKSEDNSLSSANRKISEPVVFTPTISPHADFKEISKIALHDKNGKNQLAITINAGFGERSADGILKALAKHNYKTTFFLVGEWVEDHPELTKRIHAEGHEIFNHSYSHPDYTKITAEEIKEDLEKMDDTLFEVLSIPTRPYFRAPFGYRNEKVKKAAEEIGYQHIYWSVDSIDWREGETGESIKKRVLDNIYPGAIVLLHIGEYPTGDIMDELLTEIKGREYELVSITEGME